MFLQTGKFKRMLKRAQETSGLLLAREDDILLLAGNSFLIRTNLTKMTRKEKAAVIELAGMFPTNGETFRANKLELQQELRMPETWNFYRAFEQASEDCWEKSYVMVDVGDTYVKAFQNREDNTVCWFDNFMVEAVSCSAMRPDEHSPKGPKIIDQMLMWQNENCTYAVLEYKLNNAKLSSLLENMEIYNK